MKYRHTLILLSILEVIVCPPKITKDNLTFGIHTYAILEVSVSKSIVTQHIVEQDILVGNLLHVLPQLLLGGEGVQGKL